MLPSTRATLIGALAVVGILWIIPEQHASLSTVFATTVNNTGWFGGSTSGFQPTTNTSSFGDK